MLTFPEKRWRRDHNWLLPVCFTCHSDIHDRFGDEAKWLESIDETPELAIEYMAYLRRERDG